MSALTRYTAARLASSVPVSRPRNESSANSDSRTRSSAGLIRPPPASIGAGPVGAGGEDAGAGGSAGRPHPAIKRNRSARFTLLLAPSIDARARGGFHDVKN